VAPAQLLIYLGRALNNIEKCDAKPSINIAFYFLMNI